MLLDFGLNYEHFLIQIEFILSDSLLTEEGLRKSTIESIDKKKELA